MGARREGVDVQTRVVSVFHYRDGRQVERWFHPENAAAWDKIKRWFWCSCIGQRYEGPQNTLNSADVRQLSAWIDDDSKLPFVGEPSALDRPTALAFDPDGTLYITCIGTPKDGLPKRKDGTDQRPGRLVRITGLE